MNVSGIRPLPRPETRDGSRRRVGIEVEFAGLKEAPTARLAADMLGGSLREISPFHWVVAGSELGDLSFVLDTRYRKDAQYELVRAGLDLSRGLVPAELVTEPILPEEIPRLDTLLHRMCDEGAAGTQGATLHGFGTHLNVQVAGERVEDILPVLRAYALAEAGIREEEPIDRLRAVLPFVTAYPEALLDRLAAPVSDVWSMAEMIEAYLDQAPSRNHALDMLPLFKHLRPDLVAARLGEAESVSPRPAYHFRLPDSRIGDPDWSLAREWNRWVAIEELAADTERMHALRRGWIGHREAFFDLPGSWARRSLEIWRQGTQAGA